MKIGTNKIFDLTYCTNVHPGEEWKQVLANLKQYIPPLKEKLASQKPLGVGLRLGSVAAQQLILKPTLTELQHWLQEQQLYVFTVNGFPYGKFHQQVVKDQVYAPDWTTKERYQYTLLLTRILAELLPSGGEGSISTLPVSYKPWHKTSQGRAAVMDKASVYIAQLVADMVYIYQHYGKLLHLDLEPEPDGLIENGSEVVNFFQQHLLPVGGAFLVKHLGVSLEVAEGYLLNHVRVCYDTCHFAVVYENPVVVFQQLGAVGIQVGKVQVSAALRVNIPDDSLLRGELTRQLYSFADSIYLHQVVARGDDDKLFHYRDLGQVLPLLEKTLAQEWRIHFHVPVFVNDYGLLQSTQEHITSVFKLLHDGYSCTHLEIETYTWEVLPPGLKLDLSDSLAREYEWVQKNFYYF